MEAERYDQADDWGTGVRVLMLSQSYAPVIGGVERIVEQLSEQLAKRGHEVVVATLRQRGRGAPERDGVRVRPLRSTLSRLPSAGRDDRPHAAPAPDPETVMDLRRLVREIRPDVVHGHDWLLNSYLPLDRRDGPATLLSLHDYGLVCATRRFLYQGAACAGPGPAKCVGCASEPWHYGRVRGPAVALGVRACGPRVRRHVDLFLPVSEAVRERCRLRPDQGQRVIPNFLDGLPEAPPEPGAALAGLPEEPFILYFGDVTTDKGVDRLLAAYSRLEARPPLVLVGRSYLADVERTPGVTATGALPHPLAIDVLRRAAVVAVPSILPEAFGLVALEAAAAGKPVVASAIGGLPDVVVDEETGLLVPPGEEAALAGALARLLGDAGLRERMGEAAKARAAEFSADLVVPRFEQAYRDAIEARAARGG